MEANMYGYNSHTWNCPRPDNKMHYGPCSKKNNCRLDVNDYGDNYGPGNATIDTTKKFRVEANFYRLEDTLDYYTVELTQGVRSLLMSSEGCDTHNFGFELADGLAFVISTWGSDTYHELEHGKCKGACEAGALETVSNIHINTWK